MQQRNIQKYGWRRDLPDFRDRVFQPKPIAGLPTAVDLRPHMPPVYDQGQLGSCTANAIAAALEFDQKKQGLPEFTPSRLFIYWNERNLEYSVNHDAGAQIRDGIKVVAEIGAPPEPEWPYDISQFTVKPSDQAFSDAALHLAVTYQSVNGDLNALLAALAQGYPVIFGFTVYQSFESAAVAQSGNVHMPWLFEKPLGGHAVLLVGYSQSDQRFIVRNSWGPHWGQAGYFTMPFHYLTNPRLAGDFWVLQTVK